MKKRVLIGLTTGMVIIWSSVLVVFFGFLDTRVLIANSHSYSSEEFQYTHKSLDSDTLTSYFQSKSSEYSGSPTVMGSEVISQRWIQDVKEDGKLSIDTLLESLKIQSTLDNS